MNEIFHYGRIFGIRKGPGYLYGQFNVLFKHTACEMEAAIDVQVCFQQ